MSANVSMVSLHGADEQDKPNREWIELHNEGDSAFNGEGCSITVARSGGSRPKVVTTLKAGLIIQPGERVRLVTGSSGKKSHGEPPADDTRNFHLFMKACYLDKPGLTVRFGHHQHEVCKAVFE